jgi:hypothetical protein
MSKADGFEIVVKPNGGIHVQTPPLNTRTSFGSTPAHVGYDPTLERIDVALRAVVKLAQGGRKRFCEEIGLTQDFRRLIQAAVRDLDNWREEESLFHLIRAVPAVLGFALELLRLYAVRTQQTRSWFYRRLEAQGGRFIPDLSQAL